MMGTNPLAMARPGTTPRHTVRPLPVCQDLCMGLRRLGCLFLRSSIPEGLWHNQSRNVRRRSRINNSLLGELCNMVITHRLSTCRFTNTYHINLYKNMCSLISRGNISNLCSSRTLRCHSCHLGLLLSMSLLWELSFCCAGKSYSV